jgi:peptidyl-tRNA hydrolase
MKLPVLYILMRNELDSMNSGKAMAQASHASNAFVKKANDENVDILEWEFSTSQGFGTVLVLEGKMSDIEDTINVFKRLDYVADVIHDPTYPIVDGSVVHHIPLNTCGYVYIEDKYTDLNGVMFLSKYNLHK